MIASDSNIGLVVVTSQGDAQSGGFLYHVRIAFSRKYASLYVHEFAIVMCVCDVLASISTVVLEIETY